MLAEGFFVFRPDTVHDRVLCLSALEQMVVSTTTIGLSRVNPRKGGINVRDYELVYIVAPDIGDEEVTATIEKVSQLITTRGGSIAKTDQWGRRRMAYPIKERKEGIYFLTHFKYDPKRSAELEADLRITESILRHLLVRIGD